MWTAILLPILGGILYYVANVTGIDIEPPTTKTSEEKPQNTTTNTSTGIEGGLHIYNNTPTSSNHDSENSTTTQKQSDKIISQDNTQIMGDGNTDATQINGDNNEVNNSSKKNEIENQINRNTQTGEGSQYFEDAGSDNTFCAGNDDTACSNKGTIYNNPVQ